MDTKQPPVKSTQLSELNELELDQWKGFEKPSDGYATDSVDSEIISAARAVITEDGVNRLTMVSVARKAKISRPTLYARYANRLELTREVLNQEMVRILDVAFPPPNDVEALIRTTVAVARLVAENELLRSLMKNDPAILVTYQYERLGKSQIIIIRFLRTIIERIQEADRALVGTDNTRPLIRMDDPQYIATMILAAVQGISLQSRTLATMLNSTDAWQGELTKILKGYLLQCPQQTP